jgi:hypothetical protein
MSVARLTAAVLLFAAGNAWANQPPDIDHQPSSCTVADQPLKLCATVTDDGQIAKTRIYFRRAGETFYSFVDMTFSGISFCGTLPAPREGKIRQIQYYIQAIDDEYETQRTSTYELPVNDAAACEFPPIAKDPKDRASITVYATHKKQGKKLPDGFDTAGVTFVPVEK